MYQYLLDSPFKQMNHFIQIEDLNALLCVMTENMTTDIQSFVQKLSSFWMLLYPDGSWHRRGQIQGPLIVRGLQWTRISGRNLSRMP